ncbi:toprim domain-containing protein [Ferrimonas kyonanensis]|uniref:toprim domain-containing protein n=1 Tax=Ferrimonas kyonanensis TaxID=364763 RepID=UPI0004096451|nr:toprim domain-containing protein [Ferrimonas kyonanensis]
MQSNKIQVAKELIDRNGGMEVLFHSAFPELDLAIKRAPAQVPCPKTGEGNTRFRLFRDWRETGGGRTNDEVMADVIDLVAYLRDMSKGQAADWLIDYFGGNRDIQVPNRVRRPVAYCSEAEVSKRIGHINKLSAKAVSANRADPVRLYCQHRRIDFPVLPSCLGYCEDTYHPILKTSLPAMLAQVVNKEGLLVTHHRTYITHDGYKAPIDPEVQKLMMPSASTPNGCAIRLFESLQLADGSYAVALSEGIETAMSMTKVTGIPCWAAISNTILERVELPDDIRHVFIMADRDLNQAGYNSAVVLMERLQRAGLNVEIYLPPEEFRPGEKADWNDVLRDGYPHLFPYYQEAA